MKLLTPAAANAKTAKNQTQGNYLSYILHLSPAKLSGYNVCPMASKGCEAACLNTAGRGRFDSVKAGRLRKTKLFFENRTQFIADLRKDLDAVVRKAAREGARAVVRLNGTSDLDWTSIKIEGQTIFALYPSVQFYDYTKVLRRLEKLSAAPIPNYYVIFSRSESNEADCTRALQLGFNVAAVFQGPGLPETYQDRIVIDGDTHDLRFLDKGRGVFVGLKAKGQAKRDTSGFVVPAGAACTGGQRAA